LPGSCCYWDRKRGYTFLFRALPCRSLNPSWTRGCSWWRSTGRAWDDSAVFQHDPECSPFSGL
jgi:hypothetical protein